MEEQFIAGNNPFIVTSNAFSGSSLVINSGSTFTSNSAPTDSDIHCGTEVPGTYCDISGSTPFADMCTKPTSSSGLTPQSKAIVGLVVGILGGSLVIWSAAFIVYFSSKEIYRVVY
jgi:hypothetical protein